MYIDFSNWELYEGLSCGSGTSSQVWIKNGETGQIALFKDRKGAQTTDNFSEKIESDIAQIIDLPAAKIDLAIINERIGMVSYLINSGREILVEGIQYISSKYPEYDSYDLIDKATGKFYSLDMILESVKELNIEKDLFKIFIFYFIIGNRDRHHSNWAILNNGVDNKVCPVYDNTSSLGAYVDDSKIDRCINDKNWFEAQVDRKSISMIALDGKRVRHSEFVTYLRNNHYLDTIDFVDNVTKKLTNEAIEKLMEPYEGILSNSKIVFIKRFLARKIEILKEIYKL